MSARLTLVDEVREGLRASFLSVSETHGQRCECVPSPYLHMIDPSRIGHGQEYSFIPEIMAVNRAIVRDLEDGGFPNWFVVPYFIDDSTGQVVASYGVQFSIASTLTGDDIINAAETAVQGYATSQGYTLTNGITWYTPSIAKVNALIAAALPPTPSSYQTIVTQTGTSAPAVSGSLSPVSTYPSGTTFTWARTSAGVYTLTASTAVFNTSGKTGVFVGGLNNLNASYKAVVTSTTVITITTAIGSLLGLGLLGLTATPTDAILTQTMIYVQTYS